LRTVVPGGTGGSPPAKRSGGQGIPLSPLKKPG
jgi:hypothetical protein